MTNSFWEQIATTSGEALHSSPAETRGVVVVSGSSELTADGTRVLAECVRLLRPGGWLFVYGRPRELPSWGEHLVRSEGDAWRMVFKYWVALEIDDAPRDGFLKPGHRGLLMFLKTDPRRKSPMPFYLNTAEVKVPHQFCAACKLNLKDWGGKKHLMNPKGTALSDVWRDLSRKLSGLKNSLTPDVVLERIRALTKSEGERGLHVVQAGVQALACSGGTLKREIQRADLEIGAPMLVRDEVYLGDCVAFLQRVAQEYPDGLFDLAFADPPYNLAKNYDAYDDTLADQHYLEWCNQWLDGMARTLKPGGSLFVLNLPKWAIHHAAFLNARLEFRHWIAWDALSDPRGKIMPAHYALLYYTKPGGKPVFNYSPLGPRGHPLSPSDGERVRLRGSSVLPPDSPKYCLRAACVKKRKQLGDDDKVELSDIWFDIHRIKHKRDRDAHPCQLPEKLMERIIRLTTNRGGLVFDPFCGAGTTAIAAVKLGRHFVTTECDPNYVRITNEKLAAMREYADMFGEFTVPRHSTLRPRALSQRKPLKPNCND
ncbi:MAG: site-specific DNA-methyltransferase, partial [Verrucomicrobia bacterium]|nr:site-specific DNA-methyltransferase [Verrucomicrobiota bacterium]